MASVGAPFPGRFAQPGKELPVKTRRAVAAAALSLALPLSTFAGDVWVAGSTEKIRPDEKARPSVAAEISAARNEFEAFQVVVTGPAKGVSASASPLVAGSARIEGVRLFREELLDLRNPSSLDGSTGKWPDALVPDVDDVVGEKRNAFPFDVGAGESRAIWVEVHVPKDARPGVYTGSVTVTSSDGAATVPVRLVVWDFALPSTSSLRTAFGLSYGTLDRGHGTSGADAAGLRARYGQLGLDHRISITGLTDDGYDGDFGHFDATYGALVDGTARTTLQGAKVTAVKYVGDRTSAAEHARWAQHFRQKGWFDQLFDYVCDEPPLTCQWSDINPRTSAAHAGDAEFRTLVTTQVWDADSNGVTAGIDILAPNINFTWGKPGHWEPGDQRARYDGFLASAKDKELWLYESCMSHGCGGTVDIGNPTDDDRYYTGWPTYMVDASAIRNRSMQWIDFIEQATGELYWETTYSYVTKGGGVWSDVYDFSGNGDGTLFYPGSPSRIGGQTDIPVASIRLKMIREGMEDYEYLKAVSDLGDARFARATALSLFPTPYDTEQDPAKLAAAREALARRILQLTGKPVPPPTSVLQGGGGCGSAGGGTLLAVAFPLVAIAARRRRRRTA
jgi:hypothetical protein